MRIILLRKITLAKLFGPRVPGRHFAGFAAVLNQGGKGKTSAQELCWAAWQDYSFHWSPPCSHPRQPGHGQVEQKVGTAMGTALLRTAAMGTAGLLSRDCEVKQWSCLSTAGRERVPRGAVLAADCQPAEAAAAVAPFPDALWGAGQEERQGCARQHGLGGFL